LIAPTTKYIQETILKKLDANKIKLSGETESMLRKTCLGEVMQIGPVILEDTGDGVKDRSSVEPAAKKERSGARSSVPTTYKYKTDHIGSTFLEMETTTAAGSSSRFVIRKRCGVAENIMDATKCKTLVSYGDEEKGKVQEFAVPSDRLLPWNIVAFIELKSLSVEPQDHVQEACYYCECILRVTPERKFAFGVVTNLNTCVFVASVVKENNVDNPNESRQYKHYYSSNSTGDRQVLRELASFLVTTTTSFGGESFLFPYDLFQPIDALGRGSSSSVLLVRWNLDENEDDLVLKISPNRNCIEIEKFVLRQIQMAVPDEAQRERFPLLFQAAEDLSPLDYPTWKPEFMTVFQSRYYHKPKNLNTKEVLEVWELLKIVHSSIGYAHCDVRGPNVMVNNETNRIVLIDWSFARPLSSVQPLHQQPTHPPGFHFHIPTLVTASAPVLNQIKKNEQNLQIYPADEAFSVIFLALHMKFPGAKKIIRAAANPDETFKLRDYFYEQLSDQSMDISKRTQKSVTNFMEDLERLQHPDDRKNMTIEDIDSIVKRCVKTIFGWDEGFNFED